MASFLKHKLSEFDALKNEIETLKKDMVQTLLAKEVVRYQSTLRTWLAAKLWTRRGYKNSYKWLLAKVTNMRSY